MGHRPPFFPFAHTREVSPVARDFHDRFPGFRRQLAPRNDKFAQGQIGTRKMQTGGICVDATIFLSNSLWILGRGCNSRRLQFEYRGTVVAIMTSVVSGRGFGSRRRCEARTDGELRVRTTQAELLTCLACLVAALRRPLLSRCSAAQITLRRRESRHNADFN